MAKITVYDLESLPHEKESVDARECVAEMGWSLTPPVCTASDVAGSLVEGNKSIEDQPFNESTESKPTKKGKK